MNFTSKINPLASTTITNKETNMNYTKYFVLALIEQEDPMTFEIKPKELEFKLYLPDNLKPNQVEQYIFNQLKHGYPNLLDILEYYPY